MDRLGIYKPTWCYKHCAYAKDKEGKSGWCHGVGFVSGEELSRLSTAKVFLLLEAPWKDEIRHARPLSGNTGTMTFAQFIEPLGYSRADCLLDNTIRCNYTSDHTKKYPTGRAKVEAEQACRSWDVLLYLWQPTIVGVTFHPASLFSERSHTRLIEEAVKKAFHLADLGERPLLLMGEKAKHIFAQRLPARTDKRLNYKAMMKVWQNHWWRPKEDEWPWLTDERMKPMVELVRLWEQGEAI